MDAQHRTDPLAILKLQIGLRIAWHAQRAQALDLRFLPSHAQAVELHLAPRIGQPAQQAEGAVRVAPAARYRAIGIDRVGTLFIPRIGVGGDEGGAIERLDQANVDRRSDPAFDQVGGGRLDHHHAVDQCRGQDLQAELTPGLARIADILVIGQRHAVEGDRLEIRPQAAHADELPLARLADDGNAGHALQSLGHVERRQLADVGRDDRIGDRIGFTLQIERPADAFGKAGRHDDIVARCRIKVGACRRFCGRRRLRANDQRPRAITHDDQRRARDQPACRRFCVEHARQSGCPQLRHGVAREQDVLTALARQLFKRAGHRLGCHGHAHLARLALRLGLQRGRHRHGGKREGERRRSAKLPFQTDHNVMSLFGVPRERRLYPRRWGSGFPHPPHANKISTCWRCGRRRPVP